MTLRSHSDRGAASYRESALRQGVTAGRLPPPASSEPRRERPPRRLREGVEAGGGATSRDKVSERAAPIRPRATRVAVPSSSRTPRSPPNHVDVDSRRLDRGRPPLRPPPRHCPPPRL